jgi:hypothetical protein
MMIELETSQYYVDAFVMQVIEITSARTLVPTNRRELLAANASIT